MKKFLVYLCVILVVVSTGFAIFFLVRDNEVISLSTTSMYKDVGSTFELSLNISDPNSYTEISLTTSNEDVLEIVNKEIDVKNKVAKASFKANVGGVSRINFQTNNSKFRNLYCDVVIGDGSVNYPFYISETKQLSQIGKELYDENGQKSQNPYTLSSCYELVADIDLSELDSAWSPLGITDNTPFTGVFNGNGYSINNLSIASTEGKNVGLFQTISAGATVKNVKFLNAKINTSVANEYAGVVAGVNMGTVEGIEIQSLTVNNNNGAAIIGGVVGYNKSVNEPSTKSIAKLDKCSVNFVELNGTPAEYDEAGELVAEATAVKGAIGGLTGHNLAGTIINCYTTGEYKASANGTFAGLVYVNEYLPIGAGTGVYSEDLGANVVDCYSVININTEETGLNIAALIFQNIDKTEGALNQVLGNYYDASKANGYKGIYGLNDIQYVCMAKQSAELKTVNLPSHETFSYKVVNGKVEKDESSVKVVYWDTTIWFIDGSNNGYPVLRYDANSSVINITNPSDTTIIYTAAELRSELPNGLDKHFTIGADIDLSGTQWIPVGTEKAPFTGGLTVAINPETNQPYVIKGLTITSTRYDYAGLFGVLNGAIIENLTLENPQIYKETGTHAYVGAVAGANGIEGLHNGGQIINAKVINGLLNATDAVGAITGTNSGTITNAQVITDENNSLKIEVNPSKIGYAGGITGKNYKTITVDDVHAHYYNTVKGNIIITTALQSNLGYNAGGIAGLNDGIIENTYVEINNSDSQQNVYGILFNNSSVTKAGGVAGTGKGYIKTAFVSARIIVSSNNESYAAGVVADLTTGNSVIQENVASCYVYASHIEGKYVGGLVSYLAGSDKVKIYYDEQNFFNSLYSERYVLSSDYYSQKEIKANITASAVEQSTTLKGSYAGGLVCVLQRGFVTDCYSKAMLSAKNNAGFAYEIGFNYSDLTGGVISRSYVIANFNGGNNNFNVTGSQNIHSIAEISDRGTGFMDNYFYGTDKGKGEDPKYFAGAISTVVNWFKKDEEHDVTRKRELESLRKEEMWEDADYDTSNKVTGLSPWNFPTGNTPILDINSRYSSLIND